MQLQTKEALSAGSTVMTAIWDYDALMLIEICRNQIVDCISGHKSINNNYNNNIIIIIIINIIMIIAT